MNARAKFTAGMVRLHRTVGLARRPRKVLPRQLIPVAIQREYAKVLIRLIAQVRSALIPLIDIMPVLVKSAAHDRRVDARFTVMRGDADEGKKIEEIANEVRAKLKETISPTRLEDIVKQFGKRTTDFQKEQLKKQTKAALGVDIFAPDTRLAGQMSEFVQDNVAQIKGIPERLISETEATVSRAVRRGVSTKDLAEELEKKFGYEENRAKRIARDQIGTFYSQVNSTRQKELGITKFIWRTVKDERVRPEHEEREGEVYSYDDPPEGELPGEPINCRCYAEPVFSDILGEGDEEA